MNQELRLINKIFTVEYSFFQEINTNILYRIVFVYYLSNKALNLHCLSHIFDKHINLPICQLRYIDN